MALLNSILDFGKALSRIDVQHMSENILGVTYDELKDLIYPHPPYKTFYITKRNGAPRIINEPRKKLCLLQERLLSYLYSLSREAKPCVHGFVRKRSIVTNAVAHCSTKTQHILNIDIEDFFPSITFYRVRGIFQKPPFSFSYQVSTVLAHLCTFKGCLPQGAPTSPLLANLACRSLDRDLMGLAKRHRATYTRYADDITFSFSIRNTTNLPSNICSFDSGLLALGEEIQSIIDSHSFRINANKSRLSSRLGRLEVTGLTINEFPNVKRKFIDQVRGALHAWEKFGYQKAQAEWEKKIEQSLVRKNENRPWKRQTISGKAPKFEKVLRGKLLYLHMVRGRGNDIYLRLANRFNELSQRDAKSGLELPIDTVVRGESDARKAVFVVEWAGDFKSPDADAKEMVGGQGTAFYYKDFGLVTCDHVLVYSGSINGKQIDVDYESPYIEDVTLEIIDPHTGNHWPAKIVRRNQEYDIALLQFDHPNPPSCLRFIDVGKKITVGEQGILIGYPNHSAAKPASFLREQVLNRFPRSGIEKVEITGAGSIRKGNSGGPFVDMQYRVAGVAQQGATQDSSNDECLCVTQLDKLLTE